MQNLSGRKVEYSKTTITELMIPSYANFGGKIHGGILLSLIDKVAYACASKHAGTYCVTVSIDVVDFLQPIEVGELVSLHASINFVGNTSLIVGIKVIAENVKNGSVKHTNTSYVTMVAKDDDNKPTQVPPLILESKTDVRRFVEAMKRKELKQSFKEKMDETKSTLDLDEAVETLEDQRCELKLSD
ncbi:acyl-CoA thioesterase [Fulvivirga sp. RKSG066]|uniref:acyl-CoA thioesterase n=1 Tax=Fulvivirga aurantia TaxID=2529383 RepID=UPI0012BD5067|nr:acyl-CoA thioesterase [Fulvivirga aurantia]MTI21096.1 acyl-CoA thioesterase [Fulvivirga aurantia]